MINSKSNSITRKNVSIRKFIDIFTYEYYAGYYQYIKIVKDNEVFALGKVDHQKGIVYFYKNISDPTPTIEYKIENWLS